MPVRKTRWLKEVNYSFEELNEKKVFATFTTNEGASYEGEGTIRARERPDGALAVDLVFTRHDSAYTHTDILFHLSPRQFRQLERSKEGENYEFRFRGHLKPDNDSEKGEAS